MAQLLSPFYTEALKINNPSLNLCSKTSWRKLTKHASPCSLAMESGKRRKCGRLRVEAEDSVSPVDTTADDYYAVLGLVIHQIMSSFVIFCKNSLCFH